ncbi:hypothetical protein EK21DRAFT_83544 [Setomelanomma holmii]|uniref:Uncharacterized protein n=1 Tax=Setomelanomma holmii TaxID=210430 RepID=A0A9P4HN69_9PLEO|nr:hypothetical protein EK21DRAFT_83544 [Setomelanomma holmii]
MTDKDPHLPSRGHSPVFEPDTTQLDEQEQQSYDGNEAPQLHTPNMTTQLLPAPGLDFSKSVLHKRKVDDVSDMEDDDMFDDDAMPQKHDPNSEPPPELPIFHPAVKELESIASGTVMCCTVSNIKRKEELTKTFTRSRDSLRRTVQNIIDGFQVDEFHQVYDTVVKNEQSGLIRAAKSARNGLLRSLLAIPQLFVIMTALYQHWNEDLLKIVAKDLDPVFLKIVSKTCDQLATDVAQAVNEAVGRLNETLKIDPAAKLSRAIEAFSEIHLRATTEDEAHYFTVARKKVYEAAMNPTRIRGKRVHDCRSDALTRGITAHGQDGVFLKIAQGARRDFETAFAARVETLIDQLDKVFGRIEFDVNQVCSTKEDDSDEAREFRAGLLAMVPAAREVLEYDVYRLLETCKQPRGSAIQG